MSALAGSRRFVFIDQSRALAIGLMIVGHSLDHFLADPWRSGAAYQNYQFVRGFSSTLFLMISGFSFVVASFGHFDDYLHWTPRLQARIRRIGLILLLGYVLNLWASTLTQTVASFDAIRLERLLKFDVLQNIAFGLALLHIIAWRAGRPNRFLWIALASAVAVFGLACVTYRPEIDALLPAPLQAMVNMYHRSRFPVVPYTGYILIGAVFGTFFWRRRAMGDVHKVFVIALVLALGAIGFEIAIRNALPGGGFPYAAPLKNMPGNTFARAGCAVLLIGGFFFLGKLKILFPRVCQILSKDALLIYFVHLLLIYCTDTLGFLRVFAPASMSPIQVACWIIALAVAMFALAAASGWLRTHHIALHGAIRHTMLLGGVIAFVAWTHLTTLRVLASLTFASFVVFGLEWRRTRSDRATVDVAG
ncbi:MAG: heparan-alpha-glucosaminide N-acetyltransferase domain-containing protein [Myxococcota bacterium]|nr:heparan-alpha-glucosaminide N-acetyltransferase domain-containing protein [Myxococcota bacterium]